MEKDVQKLAIYENVVTIIAIVIIWLFTGSPWSLLLLLNMNNLKYENLWKQKK